MAVFIELKLLAIFDKSIDDVRSGLVLDYFILKLVFFMSQLSQN